MSARKPHGPPEALICKMSGVREYGDGSTVRLVRMVETGRLAIQAFNEGGNNSTQVDLWDLLEWLNSGPGERAAGEPWKPS